MFENKTEPFANESSFETMDMSNINKSLPKSRNSSRGNQVSPEENTTLVSDDESCLSAFFIWFTDSFLIRLFSSVLTLQAATMWIAFALNFILTLLFAPFNERGTGSFISSWLTVPGITFFAANLFWFIFQIATHAFSLRMTDQSEIQLRIPEQADVLLFWIHSKVIIRRAFRFTVCCLTIIYMIVEFAKRRDALDALIAPLGQVPLSLMYALLIVHSLSIILFTWRSVRSLLKSDYEQQYDAVVLNKEDSLKEKHWRNALMILFVKVIIPLFLQIVGSALPFASLGSALVWLFFFIWLFWFNFFSSPIIHQNQEKFWCCNHKNGGYLTVFCSCLEKKRCSRQTMDSAQRFNSFKFFVIISTIGMSTVLLFILDSNSSFANGSRAIAWIGIIVMWLVEFLLLLPTDIKYPWENKMKTRELQSLVLSIVNSISAMMMFIGFIIMLSRSQTRTGLLFVCLLAPTLYHIGVSIYLFIVDVVYPCRSKTGKFQGITTWLESHFRVSLYPRVYYIMSVFLLGIGLLGLTIGLSIYYTVSSEAEEEFNETSFLHGNFSPEEFPTYQSLFLKNQGKGNIDELLRSNEMKLCYWNIDDFNIQDTILFAALAYEPTKQIQEELNAFYNGTNINFTLDARLSNYNARGYGDVTYFTAYTDQVAIVSIRGTTRLYDWLVNLDTWSESLIYQVISMLFPWSKFFPEYMTRRLISHMSVLERLMEDDNSTRSFVKQMINTLRLVENTYITNTTRKLIVVGHSLGGGLTKLAGISLNSSAALVSVSGPGASYSHNKNEETSSLSMDFVNRRTLNILSDRDVVPWIDKQEGLVQLLTCPLNYSFLQCHSVQLTLCNVIKICGNPKKFKFNEKICQ